MASDKLFYIAAKALIENKAGEILLLHAGVEEWRAIKEEYWDLPGGRIQSYQSALDTLQQELQEETGISNTGTPIFVTTVISNHDVTNHKAVTDSNQQVGLALMIYKVTIPKDSKIVVSKEHIGYEWVSKTEAAKRLEHKYPKEFTSSLASL